MIKVYLCSVFWRIDTTIMSRLFTVLFAFFFLASCEKAYLSEEAEDEGESYSASVNANGNVGLTVVNVGTMPIKTLYDSLDDETPTHLNFAVYDMEWTRLKQVNQKIGDAKYGTAYMQLEEGTYHLVVLAHSSTKNPTMTNLAKIQFNNSTGYTDTFLYYTTLDVSREPLSLNISLERITALCRFVISDEIPQGVTRISFLYRGGSGHFSAFTGLGVTNSKQTLSAVVQPGCENTAFNLYTFLPLKKGNVSITAQALNDMGDCVREWNLEVPMQQNQISWLTGNFFVAEGEEPPGWIITPFIDTNMHWGSEVFFTY